MMAPAGLGNDLPMRVAVGAGLLVAFGILYAFGPAYVMVLVVAALVVAAFEFYDTLRQKGYHPANLVGVTAVAGLPIAIYNRGIIAIPLVLFLAFAATAAWYLTSGGLETQPLPSSAATLFGIVYVGVLGSHAALLLQPAGQDQGKAIFLFAVVLTVACDAGSYFGGSIAGRTPLVDWVSPNKTVEGLVVGWVTTVLAGLIIKIFGVSVWGDVSLIKVLVMSIVIAAAATLGDPHRVDDQAQPGSEGLRFVPARSRRHPRSLRRLPPVAARRLLRLHRPPHPAVRLSATAVKVAIAGSTGSIGVQTIDVVRAERERYEVVGLSAGGSSVATLVAQARELRPKIVAVSDAAARAEVADALPFATVVADPAELAAEADVVVNGIVGFAGLPVTMATLRAGRRLALANKESLIAAGPVVQPLRATPGAELVPVDSEHCAVHQCLRSSAHLDRELARIVLTASGGPFRGRRAADLAEVTIEAALAHPTWRMGPKITVDSSTLMNKGGSRSSRPTSCSARPTTASRWWCTLSRSCTPWSSSPTGPPSPSCRCPTCASRSATPWPTPTASDAVRPHRLGGARPARLRTARPGDVSLPGPGLRRRAGRRDRAGLAERRQRGRGGGLPRRANPVDISGRRTGKGARPA